jgi:hypothetical protein
MNMIAWDLDRKIYSILELQILLSYLRIKIYKNPKTPRSVVVVLWAYQTDLENTTRTETPPSKQRTSSCKTKSLNNLWPQGQQRCHSEYNVKLRFSRHRSNVNACCDVGEVAYKICRIANTESGFFFELRRVYKVILKASTLFITVIMVPWVSILGWNWDRVVGYASSSFLSLSNIQPREKSTFAVQRMIIISSYVW